MKVPRLTVLFSCAAFLLAGCAAQATAPAVSPPVPVAGGYEASPDPGTTAPTQPTSATPTDASAAGTGPTSGPPGEPIFTVAVISDTQTQAVRREEAQALVNEAGLHLKALVPIIMVMTDFVEDAGGGSSVDMLQRYLIAHSTALPNGVVIFSSGDGDQAKLRGGYGYAAPAPAGYRNTFVSPTAGINQIYVAVIDYGYKYMECGYGGSDTVKSSAALAGECNNRPGTACVHQNGYSMCASAVGQLYMSTPTYFAASTIVHEMLQPFAPDGAQDDYSTPECTARMGYPAGFRDLQESQYHNDLCPFVYDNLLKGYQP